MRIVSLLPAVTEIVAALGYQGSLVGRTHECDFPASVHSVPALTHSTLDHAGRDGAAIDLAVSRAPAGNGLYRLDHAGLEAARPDLVITQELCDVCAVDLTQVQDVVDRLPGDVSVMSLEPTTLDGVLASIVAVGQVIGAADAAAALVESLRARLAAVREAVEGRARPRVALLEWLDPPYAAGHWVPHQIDAAGGLSVLGTGGGRSVRVSPGDVVESRPGVLLLAPCGWTADQAREAASPEVLAALLGPSPAADLRVVALDANAYFSRPGPRLVDGVEILAGILHPGVAPPKVPPSIDAAWIAVR